MEVGLGVSERSDKGQAGGRGRMGLDEDRMGAKRGQTGSNGIEWGADGGSDRKRMGDRMGGLTGG